jgi:UDP-glucose 4-epimerase
MEYMLKDFLNIGINSVALRYFNAAGADKSGKLGEDPDQLGNLIPRVFKASRGEYSLQVRGIDLDTRDGSAVRDYVHVSDLADGHIKAVNWLLKQDSACEVFNLCSGKGGTVLEVVNSVIKTTGRDFKYDIVDIEEGEAVTLTGSFEKAKKILGWEPTRSLDTIIEDTHRWYENN